MSESGVRAIAPSRVKAPLIKVEDKAKKADVGKATKAKEKAQPKVRILLVEDDSLFLWTLDHFLKKEGYDVCGVSNSESALQRLQKKFFDIVISDFDLPGINGKEIIRRAKSLHPKAKTVLISAFQRDELGEDQSVYLDGYLNKPIELQTLRVLLERLEGSPKKDRR